MCEVNIQKHSAVLRINNMFFVEMAQFILKCKAMSIEIVKI